MGGMETAEVWEQDVPTEGNSHDNNCDVEVWLIKKCGNHSVVKQSTFRSFCYRPGSVTLLALGMWTLETLAEIKY